jgi:uncharacterized metal-binding protein YceD (DUF177 family)
MTMSPGEFSRPIPVADISSRGRDWGITATADERDALAKRFGIVAVLSLDAKIHGRALGRSETWQLKGTFEADVVQQCVVTLEPIQTHVREHFERTYAMMPEDKTEIVDIAVETADPPDAVVDGCIDIGEATAEELALALDPFPRKPGTEFQQVSDTKGFPDSPRNPFAVLAGLREKGG